MTVQSIHVYRDQKSVSSQSLTLASGLSDMTDADFGEILVDTGKLEEFRNAEYRFLFEFPPLLIGKECDFAAAVLYRKSSELRLLFFVWNKDGKDIGVYEETDTPQHLVNFTWSFANILSVIPSGDCLTEQ